MKAAIALALFALLAGPSSAAAQRRDRTAPTAPTNLHVTALTSYVVSLAWNPSTDNSGSFSYRIQATGYPGGLATVGQHATTFDFRMLAGYTNSFYIYAVDAAGNKSAKSNTVTVTFPADTTAPTAPDLSAGDLTASTAALSWAPSVDDGPYVSYQVLLEGAPFVWAGGVTAITIQGLAPSTSYAFSVQGRDNWDNWSPVSNTVLVTTDSSDPNDTTPPTAPTDLTDAGMVFGTEVWLFWTQSTDNVDPQSVIKYEVYVNGRLDHSVIGQGRTIVYGDVGRTEFRVVAVDVAGNRSEPAVHVLDLDAGN